MIVICTDTNAAVGGYKVPSGTFEFPLQGSINIVTSSGGLTNLVVGSGDTLFVWNTGAAVEPGVDTFEMFLLGVTIVVAWAGLLAAARRIASILSAGKVREV